MEEVQVGGHAVDTIDSSQLPNGVYNPKKGADIDCRGHEHDEGRSPDRRISGQAPGCRPRVDACDAEKGAKKYREDAGPSGNCGENVFEFSVFLVAHLEGRSKGGKGPWRGGIQVVNQRQKVDGDGRLG